jgi:hypothetical protein
MAKPPEEDSFLSRWSRRKAEARDEEDTVEAAPSPVEVAAPPPPAPISDEELAALPKLEDLVPGMDIRGFLRPGVPSALKNAALQKMWLLTPAIRDYRDPAVDYAWDWNTPGGVPGDGAAPSPERAAQMMRDLFAPRPPQQQVDENHARESVTDASDCPEQAESDVTDTETDAKIQKVEFDKTISNQSDTNDTILRRRHGGALPT